MRKWKRKHKELEEKYEHYVCERCMEIGANEAIDKFLEDKKEELKVIQECWYAKDDFDKEEKFDTIIGYLDNQYKKWEAKKNE